MLVKPLDLLHTKAIEHGLSVELRTDTRRNTSHGDSDLPVVRALALTGPDRREIAVIKTTLAGVDNAARALLNRISDTKEAA